jgi:hypothetical protein
MKRRTVLRRARGRDPPGGSEWIAARRRRVNSMQTRGERVSRISEMSWSGD